MKRTISMVVTVVAALLLGACDDGASCDMDPYQPDCEGDDEYEGGGGGYQPTPTPPPSQGFEIGGVNGSVYVGQTLFVAISQQYSNLPLAFCGAVVVGSAGDFTIAVDGPVLIPGEWYALDVLADLDASGGHTAAEPRWYGAFTTPSSPSATNVVAFDFATAYSGSWTAWGEEACAP